MRVWLSTANRVVHRPSEDYYSLTSDICGVKRSNVRLVLTFLTGQNFMQTCWQADSVMMPDYLISMSDQTLSWPDKLTGLKLYRHCRPNT